jgi:hypothetical protein
MSQTSWMTADYWLQLVPQLHIHQVALLSQTLPFDLHEDIGRELDARLVREGYFQIDPPNWGVPVPDMARAILVLDQHRWMPVFAFLYDEFWLMFHQLQNVLARLLGADFQLMPDFWAWYIDPRQGQSGWEPHRDDSKNWLLPDGRPKSVTVWIALTDATPLNGCIYVVPADRDPTYNTPQNHDWRFKLPDVRALPAAAGSVLCWNSEVLHWGAHSSPRATQPRISVAYEYQRGDVPPINQPVMPAGSIPNFQMRLQLVAKQLLQYQHMYPLTQEVEAFANHLLGTA